MPDPKLLMDFSAKTLVNPHGQKLVAIELTADGGEVVKFIANTSQVNALAQHLLDAAKIDSKEH